MKKLNIFAVLVLILVTACAGNLNQANTGTDANPTTSTTAKAPGTTTSTGTVAVGNLSVVDSTTTTLGQLLGAGPLGVEIYNQTTGYYYFLDWSGTPSDEWMAYYPTIYYAASGCTNPIYMTSGSINSYTRIQGKQVFATPSASQLVVPKLLNADGSAVISGTKTYTSYWPMGGSCSNTAGTVGIGIDVQVATRATVGLPTTVTAPLSFQ